MTLKKPETPSILRFADYHDNILREPAKPVQFPLREQDQQYIRDMKYSIQDEQLKKAGAAYESASGMAANQWGISKRIFLFCPEGDTLNKLEVVINPIYEPLGEATAERPIEIQKWESCFSIPLATGNIKRYIRIRVTYQNEVGETIVRELRDWQARVWQHENDHLDGFLYDDNRSEKCIEKIKFSSKQELDEFYSKKRHERQEKQ